MKEAYRTPEITREDVMFNYRFCIEQGYTSPYQLPDIEFATDPRLLIADKLLNDWVLQQAAKARAANTLEAILLHFLDKRTVLIDAGFNERIYLNKVANDFLLGDQRLAQEEGLFHVADQIQAKRSEINRQLNVVH